MAEESKPLPAPTNWFVKTVNAILDALILNLGVKAAYAAAVAAVPWLGSPFIGYILNLVIEHFAAVFDTKLKEFADEVIIKAQNEGRKVEFDENISKFKEIINHPEATNAERAKAVQDARDAAYRIINRNR